MNRRCYAILVSEKWARPVFETFFMQADGFELDYYVIAAHNVAFDMLTPQ